MFQVEKCPWRRWQGSADGGTGSPGEGVHSPLPFFRRGVGGQGDWFSVGGRESASQVSVTRIRPIEVMCESELLEPVVKNEGGVKWCVCGGVVGYRTVPKNPFIRVWPQCPGCEGEPRRGQCSWNLLASLLALKGWSWLIFVYFFSKERKTECVQSEFCVPKGQYSVETSSSL